MKISLTLSLLLLSLIVIAQNKKPEDIFKKYQSLSINSGNLFEKAKQINRGPILMQIADWEMTLENSDIISPNYRSVDQDGRILNKVENLPIPMNGYTTNGGRVAITIGDGFIYGFIEEDRDLYYIEPLRYYDNTINLDEFIIYNTKDILPAAAKTCGYTSDLQKFNENIENNSQSRNGLCHVVQYAVCNDWSIVNGYGGAAGAESRAIGIMNDVNVNYQSAFADEIRFVISGQYNVTCSSCNPSQWTSTTNISTLLTNFTNWSINNLASAPISIPHDDASLWSRRDFDGSTVGLAWVGTVCNSYKYNVLQDINDTGFQLRVLTAHEIGHNLNAGHDSSSGNIMAPSINSTSTWSSLSISTINSFVNNANCFSQCSGVASVVNFANNSSTVNETPTNNNLNPCLENYSDITIPIVINYAPSANITAGVSIDNSSTSTNNYDYQLLTNSVTFTPGGATTQFVTVRVIDDKIEENDETIKLNLSILSGNATIGSFSQHTISNLKTGDEVSLTCCSGTDVFYGQTGTYYSMTGIFGGNYTDGRTRVLLTASELYNYGMSPGLINGLDIYVAVKNSTGPFQNFKVGYAQVSATNLDGAPFYNTTEIFSGNISTVNDSWNNITFDTPFTWNGVSSIYLNFCFDNSSLVGEDLIVGYETGTVNKEYIGFVRQNNTNGCTMSFTSYSRYLDFSPIVMLRSDGGAVVSTTTNSISNGRIRAGETAHLYGNDRKLIASIKNLGTTDMNCINAMIVTSGNGKSSLQFGGFDHSNKSFHINADNSAVYELTMYFTQAELAIWGSQKLTLNVIKSSVPIASSTQFNSDIIFSDTSNENVGNGNNIAYKVLVNGPAYFALTNGFKCEIKNDYLDSDMFIAELGSGILIRNISGDQYLIKVNSSGLLTSTLSNNASSKFKLMNGDVYFNSSTRGAIFKRSSNTYTLVNVDNNGVVKTTNTSSLSNKSMNFDSGNFLLFENGAGLVFKNGQNECWKLFVDEAGSIKTSEVPCN